ncbi:hypothetical protein WJX73_004867 [Symbiochloris irregularis]|uniref:Uncharacterized protein n=1 Tax=Symbiochloris irregularis TaxID=706552 RepID=A0AAW1NLG0_9CHLO
MAVSLRVPHCCGPSLQRPSVQHGRCKASARSLRLRTEAATDPDGKKTDWDKAWTDFSSQTGVEWKKDQRRPDIRRSEDSILNFFTNPAFFLIGGGAVLALLIIFFLLELTG